MAADMTKAELQEKLEAARGKWSELRSGLHEGIAEVESRKANLEREVAEAQASLDEAWREWGRALYEKGHALQALKKAMAPIDKNLEEQALIDKELETIGTERETLKPGVQRFSLFAGVVGEAVILLGLFVVLLVYAL